MTGINNKRRKILQKCIADLQNITLIDDIKEIKEILSKVLEAEEEANDNTPESFQETDSFFTREEVMESLESAIEGLEQVENSFDEAKADIEEVRLILEGIPGIT